MASVKFRNAEYAAVEVIKNGKFGEKDVQAGLLIGIASRKNTLKQDVKFLVLMVGKSKVKIFNLDEFKIIAFEVSTLGPKYLTVYTQEDADQTAAVEMLEDFSAAMTAADRKVKNDVYGELINIDTYKNFPDHILEEGANLTSKKPNTNKGTHASSGAGSSQYTSSNASGGKGTSSTNTYSTTSVRKPTLTSMTRKGKLPAIEKMEAMKLAVIGIKDGSVVPKPLPVCEVDKGKKISKTVTRAVGYLQPGAH